MLDRLNHVGIVVRDLSSAEDLLGQRLGLQRVRQVEVPELSVRAAFYRCGDVDLEVLEVTNAAERRRRLGTGLPLGRIEHIAIEAGSDERIKQMAADAGIKLVSADPLVVAGTRSYWSQPETSMGVMFQFIVAEQAHHPDRED